ncbi:MAG: RNA polymerase sigma factor [Bacteroidales bacterium]|nr:RNA polymerase sigma factor [Bacteroidales bacterium]
MALSEKESVFRKVYEENKDMVYRLCLAFLSDKPSADDLFQEIMINIWNNLDKFRGEAKISTWIYRIAVNTTILFNKKIKKITSREYKTEIFQESANDYKESVSNEEEDKKYEVLMKCIHQLDKQNRIIITLRLEGMSYEDIGDIVGITPNHVGVKVNRIKLTLAKLIKEAENE